MKKSILFIWTLILAFFMCACSADKQTETTNSNPATVEGMKAESTETTNQPGNMDSESQKNSVDQAVEDFKNSVHDGVDKFQDAIGEAADDMQNLMDHAVKPDSNGNNSTEDDGASLGEKNALRKAKDYLNLMSFSYDGLMNQLEFEGYTAQEQTYAVDHCGADWNEQANRKAEDYLENMAFSRDGLVDQLIFEGFSPEQAAYGADHCGADWNHQAAQKAQEYLDSMEFSREGLIDQLVFEKFTPEQAEYGVSQVGY